MRSNIYAIVFLAITVSSALGAAISVDPSNLESIENLQELQNLAGLQARQITDGLQSLQSIASLQDLQNVVGLQDVEPLRRRQDFGGLQDLQNIPGLQELQNIGDFQDVEPLQRRQDIGVLQNLGDIGNAADAVSQFLPTGELFRRAEECATCGSPDDSTDYNDSSSTTTSNTPTNAVNNAGSDSNNNYFGNVENSSSYDASNYAPSSDSHNQTNDVHPQVPVVADADCGAPCIYHDDVGVLREVSTNGCPAQVQPGHSQCNTGTSSSTINGNIISCSDIYVISKSQTKQNNCSVQPSNSKSFINILAFDCSQIGLASIFGQNTNN